MQYGQYDKQEQAEAQERTDLRGKLLDDLRLVAAGTRGPLTRDYYRIHGAYTENLWHRFFPRFADFLEDAGLDARPDASQTSQPEPELTETNEIAGNAWTITLPSTRISTLEELLDFCKVDTDVWEVERFVVNKWEVASTTGEGETKKATVEPLFQVKATLKRRVGIVAIKAEIAALKALAKADMPMQAPWRCWTPPEPGYLLEINLPDLHSGKLAWSKETGFGNYDTKIALAAHRQALEVLLARVGHLTFESVLFVIGNDLLNADDVAGRTTAGTQVANDGRYHKTFTATRDMLIEAVERLRTIAPVKIVSCPGNHDALSAWHVADSLECFFHNCADVTVNNAPTTRKYLQFGKVMLMFTHGNSGKRADYPLLMASEQKQMWGETQFREAHTGHVHQTRTEEQHGVRIRTIPALCEPDAWHSTNGFVGNLRVAEAYVWSRDEGLVCQAFYNADRDVA